MAERQGCEVGSCEPSALPDPRGSCSCLCQDVSGKVQPWVNEMFGKGRADCLSFAYGKPYCYIRKGDCGDQKYSGKPGGHQWWSFDACDGYGPGQPICCGGQCYRLGDYRRRDDTGRVTGKKGAWYKFDPWKAGDRPSNGTFNWPGKRSKI